MKTVDPTFLFPWRMKFLGVVFIVFSIVGLVLIFLKKGIFTFEIPGKLISAGLVFIFFSREKIDDERIHQLKFRALTAGFTAIFLFSFAFNYFSYTPSMHEFVTMVLSFALAVFYYAKHKL